MHRLYRKSSLKQTFGVQPRSVLNPKPCSNEPFYTEVQVNMDGQIRVSRVDRDQTD